MKNILNFTKIAILLLLIIASIKCTDDSIQLINEKALTGKIQEIEDNVINKNFEISLKNNAFDKENQIFFNELREIKNLMDTNKETEIIEIINTLIKKYNNRTYRHIYAEKVTIKNKLSKQEEVILKSYFNSLKNDIDNGIEIANYYLQEIQKLSISTNSKNFCLNAISFHKNLLIYIANNNQNIALKGRSCLDQCMYDKAYALEKSNWVEKVRFLLTAAETTALWLVSCAWDCAIK